MKSLLLLAIAAASAWSAELVLPPSPLERAAPVPILFGAGPLANSKGEFSIRWTDVHGRLVEDRKIPVELLDENEIGFTLDLRRAIAMHNELSAHFHFEGVNRKGQPDRRDEDAKIEFIASPPDRAWVGRNRTLPGRPVNSQFVETREQYKEDRANQERLKRRPSLIHPVWLARIRERPVDTAKFYAPHRRQTVAWYSGNLHAPEGRARRLIPIAVNDPPGGWEARVKDLLSGQTRTAAVEVF